MFDALNVIKTETKTLLGYSGEVKKQQDLTRLLNIENLTKNSGEISAEKYKNIIFELIKREKSLDRRIEAAANIYNAIYSNYMEASKEKDSTGAQVAIIGGNLDEIERLKNIEKLSNSELQDIYDALAARGALPDGAAPGNLREYLGEIKQNLEAKEREFQQDIAGSGNKIMIYAEGMEWCTYIEACLRERGKLPPKNAVYTEEELDRARETVFGDAPQLVVYDEDGPTGVYEPYTERTVNPDTGEVEEREVYLVNWNGGMPVEMPEEGIGETDEGKTVEERSERISPLYRRWLNEAAKKTTPELQLYARVEVLFDAYESGANPISLGKGKCEMRIEEGEKPQNGKSVTVTITDKKGKPLKKTEYIKIGDQYNFSITEKYVPTPGASAAGTDSPNAKTIYARYDASAKKYIVRSQEEEKLRRTWASYYTDTVKAGKDALKPYYEYWALYNAYTRKQSTIAFDDGTQINIQCKDGNLTAVKIDSATGDVLEKLEYITSYDNKNFKVARKDLVSGQTKAAFALYDAGTKQYKITGEDEQLTENDAAWRKYYENMTANKSGYSKTLAEYEALRTAYLKGKCSIPLKDGGIIEIKADNGAILAVKKDKDTNSTVEKFKYLVCGDKVEKTAV